MDSQTSNTPQPASFQCPNCGASLPNPEKPTIRCSYCGSNIIVPTDYLPETPDPNSPELEPVIIRISSQSGNQPSASNQSARRIAILTIFLIAAVGLGIALLSGAGLWLTTSRVIDSVEVISSEVIVTAPPEITVKEIIERAFPTETTQPTGVPFANLVLQFGEEGSGAGSFQDPRQIAIDQNNNIYVADYTTGRVQKFDNGGKFVQLWRVPESKNETNFIFDLAVDFNDNLYVVRSGDILIYNSENQQATGSIPSQFPDTYYMALAIDPANMLHANVRSMSGNDLIKLDPDGEQLLRKEEIITEIDPSIAAEDDAIAVDGLGNTYFLSAFEPQVYKYDANGRYLDRFGSRGDGPGKFFNPSSLAIDAQGRIYIVDNGYIQIFDENGAFIYAIPWDYTLGSPRDISLDLTGNLFVVTSQGKVLKYELNW